MSIEVRVCGARGTSFTHTSPDGAELPTITSYLTLSSPSSQHFVYTKSQGENVGKDAGLVLTIPATARRDGSTIKVDILFGNQRFIGAIEKLGSFDFNNNPVHHVWLPLSPAPVSPDLPSKEIGENVNAEVLVTLTKQAKPAVKKLKNESIRAWLRSYSVVKAFRAAAEKAVKKEKEKEQKEYTVMIHGKVIPVTKVDHTTSMEDCLKLPAFIRWVQNFEKTLDIRKIEIQTVDRVGPVIRFMKINAEIYKDEILIPGIAFLRGDSIAVMAVINEGDNKYIVVEKHPRASIGQTRFVEIPAALYDGGPFTRVIEDLLENEVGMVVPPTEPMNLNNLLYGEDLPIYLSPGASDEGIRFFLIEFPLTKPELDALIERVHSHEYRQKDYVEVDIVPLDDLNCYKKHGRDVYYCLDARTIIGIQLYEMYQARK